MKTITLRSRQTEIIRKHIEIKPKSDDIHIIILFFSFYSRQKKNERMQYRNLLLHFNLHFLFCKQDIRRFQRKFYVRKKREKKPEIFSCRLTVNTFYWANNSFLFILKKKKKNVSRNLCNHLMGVQ